MGEYLESMIFFARGSNGQKSLTVVNRKLNLLTASALLDLP